ncbi:uncharacterized protein V1516DRAFT_669931 [Lipomyces oligophaga]|uniref:uncharacterized protein n=1 Tax=Lipomyces oligophaga TaxID=45792 RepID=UPI0034CD607B
MKRLIILCDGTWQNSLVNDDSNPSNITRIARAILPNDERTADEHGSQIPQIVYYHPGIATQNVGFWNRVFGLAAGKGIVDQIEETYAFISSNYEPDDEIFFFGFSRGSYMVRSICGFILDFGLLTRYGMPMFVKVFEEYSKSNVPAEQNPALNELKRQLLTVKASQTEPRLLTSDKIIVKFIGCFDTVGALGIPKLFTWQYDKYGFLDVKLNEKVQNARQALALDETRHPFVPTLWFFKDTEVNRQKCKQVWFNGVHINIGGGNIDDAEHYSNYLGRQSTVNPNTLSDGTLIWMVSEAEPFLAFDLDFLHQNIISAGTIPDGRLVGKVDQGQNPTWFFGPIGDNYHGLGIFWKILGHGDRTAGKYSASALENMSWILAHFLKMVTLISPISPISPKNRPIPESMLITNEFIHESVLYRNGPTTVGVPSGSLQGVCVGGDLSSPRFGTQIAIPVQRYNRFEEQFFQRENQNIHATRNEFMRPTMHRWYTFIFG